MLRPIFSRTKIFPTFNKFYLQSLYCSNKPAEKQPSGVNYAEIHRRMHAPNNFERKILVWTGRYKTLEEVPTTVSVENLEKARNKFRIKVANYMMLATLVACVFMAISGKRAAERGESLAQMNLDWHKEMNKQAK